MAKSTRWGIVCTARATLAEIARFAAHHLDLGAAHVHILLDAPLPGAETLAHPALSLAPGATGPDALHRRQMANAARVYADTTLDWLAHIDCDEFLLPAPGTTIARSLAKLPTDIEQARVMPAELLAPVTPGPISHFKLTPHAAGQSPAILEELYPDYGLHLQNGLISHGEGKVFCRTGLAQARPGIHQLRFSHARRPSTQRLSSVRLGHAHATGWDDFRARLPARRASGSYSAARDGRLSLQELFGAILQTEGEAGLRTFYDTVCTATPAHLAALAKHGMLIAQDLQLDAKARKLFPDATRQGRV